MKKKSRLERGFGNITGLGVNVNRNLQKDSVFGTSFGDMFDPLSMGRNRTARKHHKIHHKSKHIGKGKRSITINY
jgi:hypothetical protein